MNTSIPLIVFKIKYQIKTHMKKSILNYISRNIDGWTKVSNHVSNTVAVLLTTIFGLIVLMGCILIGSFIESSMAYHLTVSRIMDVIVPAVLCVLCICGILRMVEFVMDELLFAARKEEARTTAGLGK